MKKVILTLVLVLFSIEVYPQSNLIIKTKDGGYLLMGNIQNGIMDVVYILGIYLVKMDPFGNQQ